MRFLILILFILGLTSCEKKELPVPAYNRGNAMTVEIEMTTNYKNQVWYSLSDQKVVSTNDKTDWDLVFEASPTGTHILINGANAMKVYQTSSTQLSDITDTTGLAAGTKADSPTGNLDSTAIGDWQTTSPVYILNMGYDEAGQERGYYKLKVLSVSGSQFTFEYGDVYGTQIYQGTATKDAAYNFMPFSLVNHQQIWIEPKQTDYDLCFTQYTHFFTSPFQYYQVTGVLNNTYHTRITNVHDRPFDQININDTLGRMFSSARNSIGYEWKTFSLSTNLYTIDPAKCYIIQDSKGFYYKLHFIDFYNSLGIKGYPKFEFQKL